MSDILVGYILIGLAITALFLLFSKETSRVLEEKSLLWRFLWSVLVTTLWFPIIVLSIIVVIIKASKESEE